MANVIEFTIVAKDEIGSALDGIKAKFADLRDSAGDVAGKIGAGLKTVGGIAAGAFAVGIGLATDAIVGTITAANDWAGTLDSLGDVLGTNAADSAALAVAIQGVGGDVGAITGQMAKFTQGLRDQKGELGPTGQLLTDMGIAFEDANGKMLSSTDIIKGVADKVSQMPDGLEKSKLMMDLFGKSGKDMTDTLAALTTEGFDKAKLKAQEFGLSMSDEAVGASVEMGKKMEDLKMRLQGIAVSIGSEVLPQLLPLIDEFMKFALTVLPPLMAALRPLMDELIKFAKAIMPDVSAAMQEIAAVVREVAPVIGEVFKVAFEAIKIVWDTVLKPTLGFLLAAVREIVEWFKINWPIITQIVQAFGADVKAVFDAFNRDIAAVKSAIEQFKADWAATWTAIAGFFEAKWSEITSFFATLNEKFSGLGESIKNAFLAPLRSIGETLKGFVLAPLRALVGTIRDALQPVTSLPIVGDLAKQAIAGLPKFAEGGIVTKKTLAIIGEKGPEAVVPLKRMGSLAMGSLATANQIARQTTMIINTPINVYDTNVRRTAGFIAAMQRQQARRSALMAQVGMR